MSKTSILLMAILLCMFSVNASDLISDSSHAIADSSSATLSVKSNMQNVKVYIDSVCVGVAPFISIAINEGVHILRFVPPDERSWYKTAIVETIVVARRQHIEREINFPRVIHITSEPPGAHITYNDSIIGQTPFIAVIKEIPSFIRLIKGGFEEIKFPIDSSTTKVHAVLPAILNSLHNKSHEYLASTSTRNPIPIYITTSAAVVSGVAAAFFKIRADNTYADYRRTGNPATLDRIKKYDRTSGIALLACEVNVFLLCYFLLSR